MELEEGQIVLCTVEKIIGTTIFVKIENNGIGTITTSEIAPGRIRNLRDYVIPGKKIVCKIIKLDGNKIHLSLRRVKQNEKKELLDKISKEKSYRAILKTIIPNYEEVIGKIIEKYTLIEFFDSLNKNPELLKKYTDKKSAEKIIKILKSKEEKPKVIKQNFNLSNKSSEGIKIVKNIILDTCKNSNCEINYIAAGKYNLSLIGKDFKIIKSEMQKIIENIEKLAKKQNCFFEIGKS